MGKFSKFTAALLCGFLVACTTTPKPDVPPPPGTQGGSQDTDGSSPPPPDNSSDGSDIDPNPSPDVPEIPSDPIITVPPEVTPPSNPIGGSSEFSYMNGWNSADLRPALKAFQRGCVEIQTNDQNDYFNASFPNYGRVSDWRIPCAIAAATPAYDLDVARGFFEREFLPLSISNNIDPSGLVTGYYQPEISARRVKDSVHSEPILTKPTNPDVLTWPRSQITETASTPIAYGRPIDVFFMQVQGSGVLNFPDGQKIRAAYAANNGKPYTSIGGVLIRRGELTKDSASKQSIEDWMIAAGPVKSRELMNENARYIFFAPETILPDEGPKGAMRVPLTAMGSIAVDPSYHPYGAPVWIETQIPAYKGDYRGVQTGLLTIAQDTGKAIRGQLRADLYFGSGLEAGDRAGVMKHPAHWTILLPFHLALQLRSIS